MANSRRPLRFCLVGTGYWAPVTHAPALASAEGIEFAAVWGRDADAAARLAAQHGDLVPQHEQLGVLGGRRPAEQDQPAAEPDEDEVEQAEGHG